MATRFLLPLLLIAIYCSTNNARAQSTEPIDSKHIFSNADLVLVFQIERLQEHLTTEAKAELNSIHEWLGEATKLDTRKCKEVIVQFGADDYGDWRSANESVGFVFRCEDEIPEDQINDMLGMANWDQVTHKEKDYYIQGHEPAFYFSDNSLLIAERARIDSQIDKEADSMGDPDVDILERVSRDKDICAHVNLGNETFREFFKGLFHEIPELRDSTTMENIVSNAASATFHVSLGDMIPLKLELEANESADMDELEEAAREFVAALKSFVEMLESEMTNAPSEEISDAAESFCTSLIKMLDEAEIESDDSSVTITISNVDDAKNVVSDFVKMMGGLVEFIGNM